MIKNRYFVGENTIKDRFYIPKMEFYLKKWESVVQVYNLSILKTKGDRGTYC